MEARGLFVHQGVREGVLEESAVEEVELWTQTLLVRDELDGWSGLRPYNDIVEKSMTQGEQYVKTQGEQNEVADSLHLICEPTHDRNEKKNWEGTSWNAGERAANRTSNGTLQQPFLPQKRGIHRLNWIPSARLQLPGETATRLRGSLLP